MSSPTLCVSILSNPCWLMVPPIKVDPTFLDTGMLSPVIMDSSTDEFPNMTSPGSRVDNRKKNFTYHHKEFFHPGESQDDLRLQSTSRR